MDRSLGRAVVVKSETVEAMVAAASLSTSVNSQTTVFHGRLPLFAAHNSSRSASLPNRLRERVYDVTKLTNRRTRSQAFQILANANVSGNRVKQVIMVDPVEAKQMAAKQMEEIKAREKTKRKRKIEAINGAWAMIGLTAGLVIEGLTGKNILAQLAGEMLARLRRLGELFTILVLSVVASRLLSRFMGFYTRNPLEQLDLDLFRLLSRFMEVVITKPRVK